MNMSYLSCGHEITLILFPGQRTDWCREILTRICDKSEIEIWRNISSMITVSEVKPEDVSVSISSLTLLTSNLLYEMWFTLNVHPIQSFYILLFKYIFTYTEWPSSSGIGPPRPRCSCCTSPGWAAWRAGWGRWPPPRCSWSRCSRCWENRHVVSCHVLSNYVLGNEEQEKEDNGDKVVEGGEEAPDDALVDGVGDLYRHLEKYRDTGEWDWGGQYHRNVHSICK